MELSTSLVSVEKFLLAGYDRLLYTRFRPNFGMTGLDHSLLIYLVCFLGPLEAFLLDTLVSRVKVVNNEHKLFVI